MGRTLIVIGAALMVLGVFVTFGERLGIRLGRLPGDIEIKGRSGTFYFPVVTCIVLSAALSLVAWLFSRR